MRMVFICILQKLMSKKIKLNFSKFLKKFRFTIDYKEDFIFFKKITSLIGKQNISIKNLERILNSNESIKNINFEKDKKYQENLRKKVKIYYNYNSSVTKKINFK